MQIIWNHNFSHTLIFKVSLAPKSQIRHFQTCIKAWGEEADSPDSSKPHKTRKTLELENSRTTKSRCNKRKRTTISR